MVLFSVDMLVFVGVILIEEVLADHTKTRKYRIDQGGDCFNDFLCSPKNLQKMKPFLDLRGVAKQKLSTIATNLYLQRRSDFCPK